MDEEIKRCYEVLELDSTATPQEVKQAWREMAKVWHPDRFPNEPKLQHRGQEKLKAINAAYDLLSNFLADTSKPQSTTSQPHIRTQPPPPTKQNAVANLEMLCRHCNGLVEFSEDMERATVPCPHCGNELFLWRKNSQKNNSGGNNQTKHKVYPNQRSEISPNENQTAKVLYVIGFICWGFGAIDFIAGRGFHFDITGVPWSPPLAGFIGWLFTTAAQDKEKK